MILPKILIYKERFSLDEFHMDSPGGNKDLFDALRKCKDVVWDFYGDLEGQYLSIFNAAYYIAVDMMSSELSYLKVNDYCDYVERKVRGHHRKVEAVLCMARALTLGHQSASFKQGLKDVLHEKMGEFYNCFFTQLPATFTHNPLTPLFSPQFSYSPVLTYSYLEQHREEMEWKKWTNEFTDREVHEIVWKAGKSKEERLNLLDAILEDAKRNGCKNVEVRFSALRAKLEESADFPLGHLYRKKKDLPAEPAPAPQQEDTSTQRIQELEAEIASLKARMKELEEENRRKDENMARMKRQMSEHAQKANNDFTFDKSVGTVVAHADNITIKYT